MLKKILFYCFVAIVLSPGLAFALDPDLSETAEIQFGSEAECPSGVVGYGKCALRAKATELSTAPSIYEYVRNGNEYALYQGSRSNAINSFLGARSNDVDMASVLIAMLRSRNVPARYAVGTVRIESDKVMNWLDVQNLDLAVSILKDQGIQKVTLSSDRSTVDFEHVWVEALVSYANYRGAGADAASVNCGTQRSACRWVGLAPAFKLRQPDDVAIDVFQTLNFDYTRYFNAIKNNDVDYKDKNPLEIYQEQILQYLRTSYPGKALEDVSDKTVIAKEALGILPNSLPFKTIGAVRTYNSIAEHDLQAQSTTPVESKAWAKYVRITASKQTTDANGDPAPDSSVVLFNKKPFLLSEISTKKLLITFSNCGTNCVSAQITLDGIDAGTTTISNGSLTYLNSFVLDLELDASPAWATGGTDKVAKVRYAGNVVGGNYLIGVGGESSNWSQVHRAAANLLAANDQYAIVNDSSGVPYVDTNKNGAIDSGEPRLIDNKPAMDALTGGLLYTAMNLYYAKFTDSIRRLNSLNHVVSPIDGFIGVVSSVYDVEYVDGTAFSVMPGGLLIDMKGQYFSGMWRKDSPATFAGKHFELIGHILSSLEHEIWQELTGYDAISTVRGIQFAVAAGAPLLNPKKNSTVDTVPMAYPGMGFGTQPPTPFKLRESTVFNTKMATWYPNPNPGGTLSFEMMKGVVSPSENNLLHYIIDYSTAYGTDSMINSFDTLENMFLANPGATYNATFCNASYTGTGTQLLPQLQSCYYSVIDNPSSSMYYDYLDENQGFSPAAQIYRSTPIQNDQYPNLFVQWLRNQLYSTGDFWFEYVLAGRMSVGPFYKFAVYIEKRHKNSNNDIDLLSFIIQNKSVAAGGGYVDGTEPLEQHADTTGVVFDNEVFTDQNLNSLVSNDLVKTPSTSDPVSTVTGNMYHDETDIVIKGRGLDYSFTRTYNSGATSTETGNGPLGPNWTHSYNMRLISNDYGRYPNYPSSQAPENGNGKTSSISYVDERGGEVNYLLSDLGSSPTYAVTKPRGVFDNLALNTPVSGQYTLTFRNGVKYIFEGSDLKVPGRVARLKAISDPYGNQLNFAYNGSGKLSAVTDNLGISGRTGLAFSYELVSGRLSSVSDWQGRSWTFAYSGGQLVSVTNPRGDAVTYTYQPKTNLLVTITKPQDRNGKKVATTFRYYRNSRAFDYTNALGQAETLDYDLYRKGTRVTDARGFIREHYYDADGVQTKLVEPDGAALLFTANADGLRNSKIDGLGYKTQYSYMVSRAVSSAASDTFGKVTQEIDPLNQAIKYDYGAFDQIAKVTDKNAKVWERVYYTTTNTTTGAIAGKLQKTLSPMSTTVPLQEYTYYANGNVKQITEYISLTDTTKKRITTLTYDTAGLNLLQKDVTGSGQTIRTIYTYDALGRKKTETLQRRTSATNALILNLTNTYDYDVLGHVTKVTDTLGNYVESFYDANGNVTEERASYKRADGSFDTRVYARYEYDLADRRIKTTDVEGYVTQYGYDASNNPILIIDANKHVKRFEYDAQNRQTAVIDGSGHRTEMKYDLAGHLIKIIDANGNVNRIEYDALGRKTKSISAMGFETQYGYDANGNLTKLTDPNAVAGLQPKNSFGSSVYNEYDSLNRLTRAVDASNAETVYTYDLLGNVLTIKDAEGRITTMTYDNLGRLIQVKDPLVETPVDKVTSLAYDEANNLLTFTDRKGQITRNTYDNLNRLTLTEFLTDATQESRGYDIYGNLVTLSNAAVTYTYEYDVKNRLKKKIDNRLNKFLAWSYDPVGNLRTKTDYQGQVTTYQYDSSNRLVSLSNPGYVQVTYHYDDAGRLLDRILSSGAMTQYGYDNDNRLNSLSNKSAAGAAASQNFVLDRVGNITQVTDGTNTSTFAYDPEYRLLNANYPGTVSDQSYTYDKVGNRKTITVSWGVVAYVVNAGNRLIEVRQGSATGAIINSYVYDDNGSQIQKKNAAGAVLQSYSYDQKRRISQSTIGSVSNAFLYDPNDYRIQKVDTSATLKYLLEGEHLEATYDQTNALKARYLRGAVIDEIVYGYNYSGAQAVASNYHHDQLQSVVALTAHDGVIQQTVQYDPFGNTQAISGSSQNSLQYTGRERDADSGLYYYRARYYDPAVGRFLTEDPLAFKAGINFYAYVNNNPINASDPTGEQSLTINAGFIGGTFGYADSGVPFSTVNLGMVGSGIVFNQNPTLPGANAPGALAVGNCLACGATSQSWQTGSNTMGITVGPVSWSPISINQPTVINQNMNGGGINTVILPGTTSTLNGGWSWHPETWGLNVDLGASIEFGTTTTPEAVNRISLASPMGLAVETISMLGSLLNGNAGGGGAGGGFVLYPGQPNVNMMANVYSKTR